MLIAAGKPVQVKSCILLLGGWVILEGSSTPWLVEQHLAGESEVL